MLAKVAWYFILQSYWGNLGLNTANKQMTARETFYKDWWTLETTRKMKQKNKKQATPLFLKQHKTVDMLSTFKWFRIYKIPSAYNTTWKKCFTVATTKSEY